MAAQLGKYWTEVAREIGEMCFCSLVLPISILFVLISSARTTEKVNSQLSAIKDTKEELCSFCNYGTERTMHLLID